MCARASGYSRERREVGSRNDILILQSQGVGVAEKETEGTKNGDTEVKQGIKKPKHGHCIFLNHFIHSNVHWFLPFTFTLTFKDLSDLVLYLLTTSPSDGFPRWK